MSYLFPALILCSVMLSIVFLLAWQNFGRKDHALVWSLTFFLGAIQYLTNLFSEQLFSNRDVYWVVGTAQGVMVVLTAMVGFRLWAKLPPRIGVAVLTGATVVVAVALFSFGYPHVGLQMFLGPAFGGLICLLIAGVILRKPTDLKNIAIAGATVFGLLGLCQILAGGLALMQGATLQMQWLETYQQVNFIALPAGYLGTGMFTVLIVASDLSAAMRSLALTDEMTGIANRRGFEQQAGPLISRARRGKQPLSVIMCDVDHFKLINDQSGHSAGDHALKALSRMLASQLREGDVLGRLGGEEFALALPGSDLAQAEVVAERLRQQLESTDINWRPEPLQLTASFGVSALRDQDHAIEDLLQRADRALYQSKNNGRNRVTLES